VPSHGPGGKRSVPLRAITAVSNDFSNCASWAKWEKRGWTLPAAGLRFANSQMVSGFAVGHTRYGFAATISAKKHPRPTLAGTSR
jgi:hypothetical protein